jgi:beta-glucanase (GH16 family)
MANLLLYDQRLGGKPACTWPRSIDQVPLGALYPAPFARPFQLLLNVVVGAHWPGNPDQTTEFPRCLAVDYVRVYQNREQEA